MGLIIKEVTAKSILSRSGIPGAYYCINPYTGCLHGCRYCYASFMKKYTSHTEEWGSFVDVKINAPDILRKQMRRAVRGNIIISSVTDPYQPVEAEYKITRQCIEELIPYQFPLDILTKSPLVLRDIDLIKKFEDVEVGITITTDKDDIRKTFEPKAPAIESRIKTIKTLHEKGIHTYAFIGPLLPMNPESLSEKIREYADYIFIDRMNYIGKTLSVFNQMGLKQWLDSDFLENIIKRLKKGFDGKSVNVC